MLHIDELHIELEHPIAQALACRDLVIVRFRHDAAPQRYGAFDNLFAVNRRGERVWVAELPDTGSDAYVEISSREPLVAHSWSGFRCTLDPASGAILQKTFTK